MPFNKSQLCFIMSHPETLFCSEAMNPGFSELISHTAAGNTVDTPLAPSSSQIRAMVSRREATGVISMGGFSNTLNTILSYKLSASQECGMFFNNLLIWLSVFLQGSVQGAFRRKIFLIPSTVVSFGSPSLGRLETRCLCLLYSQFHSETFTTTTPLDSTLHPFHSTC